MDVAWLLVAAGACPEAIRRYGRLTPAAAFEAATSTDRKWAPGHGFGDGGDRHDYGYGYGFGSGGESFSLSTW